MYTARVSRRIWIVVALVMLTVFPSLAAAYRRHYYSSWSYHSSNSYYYRSYYYKPSASYDGYRYHYCVYYPTRPRYVYYYKSLRAPLLGSVRFDERKLFAIGGRGS